MFKVFNYNNFSVTFIAITREEYSTIKLFFPNSKIILIPNNIPFKNFLNFEFVNLPKNSYFWKNSPT